MAYVDVDHMVGVLGAANNALGTIVLDAAGEKAAIIFQAPKTGSIRKIAFRTASVTSATDTDARLETVSAVDGTPTGTLWGVTTNATIAAASITGTTWVTSPAFTADASVTQGDLVAAVLAPTGTPNYQVSICTLSGTHLVPYRGLFTTSWALNGFQPPLMAVEYSDGSYAYVYGLIPASGVADYLYASDDTPDERAILFSLPYASRLAGVDIFIDMDGDFDLVLYDSDGSSVLATRSFDKDQRGATFQDDAILMFAESVELAADTDYYLAIKPTTTTDVAIDAWDFASTAVMGALPGGANIRYAERTDAGAWTEVTTRRLQGYLIMDGIDTGGAAAGGGKIIGAGF